MLRGVWRKKPMKHHTKRRRPMMSGLLKYLSTDSHMHAAMLSPPSPRELSTARKAPFLDTESKGEDRFLERAAGYLKSDPHLYGPLVDAAEFSPFPGPMQQIERVVVAVSKGILFIEESRINGVDKCTNAKKRRSEETHLPKANVVARAKGDKVKNKVLSDFRSSSVPGKKGVMTRSRKVEVVGDTDRRKNVGLGLFMT